MYQKVSTDLNFVDREKQIEKFWKDQKIFEKSIESRKEGTPYVFYDGPPTANGKPHIGHVLTRVIKDMIPRYRTMKGYMVPRKAGWDTHGLPVELEVEKMLGNSADTLRDPNLAAIFIGIVLGLVLGSIPFVVPGISTPVKLGLAGGPIVVGILIGSFGPRFRLVTYTTRSANLMLRGIGLSLYLACLGLDAGEHFFETVMRPEGVAWVGIGFVITFVPVVFMALLALRITHHLQITPLL
mgnify:CR=1 FL=1